jgi:lipopolysaccharide biosynthesis protein
MRLIAFYLPQFHPIPENDLWWGKGFTEWTNVTRVGPLFKGHHQPQLPAELGFYDLRVAETREAQAELARAHGISGFCYYYYWLNGKKLLQRPLEEVIASGKPDFPFCVCWANENWTRRWDGGDSEILAEQKYSEAGDREFLRALIPIFRDPRYIRVDDKPLLLIYRSELFSDGRRTAQIWREEAAKAGLGLYLVRGESFSACDPGSIGFDAAYEFPPNGLQANLAFDPTRVQIYRRQEFSGRLHDYGKLVEFMSSRPEADYHRFHGVMVGWDNTARRRNQADIFVNSDPTLYYAWLSEAIKKTSRQPDDQRLIFINAWNEWAEGCHLEPDNRYQRAYLEATVAAVSGRSFVYEADHASKEAPNCNHDRADARPIAQQMLDRHWYSTSWQITSPLRTLARHFRGLPKETRPLVYSQAEAEQLINTMRSSFSWKMTAPIRWGGRFFRRPSEGN